MTPPADQDATRRNSSKNGDTDAAHTAVDPSTNGTAAPATRGQTVYSTDRSLQAPDFEVPAGMMLDTRMQMDGLDFLERLPSGTVPLAFLDPQYRGILDKMAYGNEGESRFRARTQLPQMSETTVARFIKLIDAALMPSGHLFVWIDKFHLCTGIREWFEDTSLEIVDLVNWFKQRMGMGYRTRRATEYLFVLQKRPKRAKGVWAAHDIPDTWLEKTARNGHTHAKPVGLQAKLIAAVTNPGDVVIDPAAGSFSVMDACAQTGRRFLGCDING